MYNKNCKSSRLTLVMLFIFSSGFLWARDVKFFVEDADLSMPLEGAVIRSWDGSEYECDEEGRAVISVPDSRRVSVEASYPNYVSARILIPAEGNSFLLELRLGEAIESRELQIDAARPGSGETRSARSVAISGETMEQSSRIGLVEDVMTSIKLLPGVGYAGFFNAMPSIRGGDPGDLKAVLDGFYIENPYFWGGGFSIFDPHMVGGAKLSHGIYSARYGHTISGLLEVSSKKAPPDHAEMEIGISTSAVNLNAAIPLGQGGADIGKGGLMLMGKATYWDPFVWSLKQLSKAWDNETLDILNMVSTAPYIRSGAASFYYRFNSDLEVNASAFIGADGVGFDNLNEEPNRYGRTSNPLVGYRVKEIFNYENLNTFFIMGLSYNPRPSMVLKANAGAGYERAEIDENVKYDYLKVYEDSGSGPTLNYELDGGYLDHNSLATYLIFNLQSRIDFDWDLGNGFLLASGVEELYKRWGLSFAGKFIAETETSDHSPLVAPGQSYYRNFPVYEESLDNKNEQFNTAAYVLGEYLSPGKRFGAELGLRVDHLFFKGKDFSIRTMPVLNPRLNLDLNLLQGTGFLESLDVSLGTGLFSSHNLEVAALTRINKIKDYELEPNRSWTSVLGLKGDFPLGISLNMEGFYKYIFNRLYSYEIIVDNKANHVFRFDGEGMVWGFDLMLQKLESRYWDGWLSYTFTYARYHENEKPSKDLVTVEDSYWYYPDFHRFHNLNMVLNYRPSNRFNIYTRLGLASGQPKPVVGKIIKYQVVAEDESGNEKLINKYYRESEYSDNSRSTWSIPLDMKFSFFIFSPQKKTITELYLAAENILSLVYTPKANSTFNPYTGEDMGGSDSANFELPVPMASVGVKWSY